MREVWGWGRKQTQAGDEQAEEREKKAQKLTGLENLLLGSRSAEMFTGPTSISKIRGNI